MTAADTARIVEKVLLEAGIIVHISGIQGDTETARTHGGSVEVFDPRKVDVTVSVAGFRPTGGWEKFL